MVPKVLPAASEPGRPTRPQGSSGSRWVWKTRGSPPIRRSAWNVQDRCAWRSARRDAWTASTGGTDSHPHPNRSPRKWPGTFADGRGHTTCPGTFADGRGHRARVGTFVCGRGHTTCPGTGFLSPTASKVPARGGTHLAARNVPTSERYMCPLTPAPLNTEPGTFRGPQQNFCSATRTMPGSVVVTSARRWGGCRVGRVRGTWRRRRQARRPPRSSGRRRSRRG